MAGFCGLLEEFSKSRRESWPPRITLKTSDRITSVIDRVLDEYPDGQRWLRKAIYRNLEPGSDLLPMEDEIRLWLVRFMLENRTPTLDDIFALAMQKDKEIKEERKKQADGSRRVRLG